MLVAATRTGFTFEVPVRSPARYIRILHHRDDGVRILPRDDVFMTLSWNLTCPEREFSLPHLIGVQSAVVYVGFSTRDLAGRGIEQLRPLLGGERGAGPQRAARRNICAESVVSYSMLLIGDEDESTHSCGHAPRVSRNPATRACRRRPGGASRPQRRARARCLILALQDGPTVLVGHSWAGTVISEAGGDPKVSALVYVTARARRR